MLKTFTNTIVAALITLAAINSSALENAKFDANRPFSTETINNIKLNQSVPPLKSPREPWSYFDFSDYDDDTEFKKLATLFKAGRKPLKEEIVGWYSGKWCSNENPDELKASLFIGEYENDGQTEESLRLGAHYCSIAPNTSCDNPTPKQIKYYSSLKRYKPESLKKEFVYMENTFVKHVKLRKQIRKYGDILIVKESYTNNFLGKYDTRYHYFFKNVTPQ